MRAELRSEIADAVKFAQSTSEITSVVKFAAGEFWDASYYRIYPSPSAKPPPLPQGEASYNFATNAKGDEKKEFENKHSDKAFRCEQEKKTADLSRAHTCRM